MRPTLLIMWTAFQSFILRHNNNNNDDDDDDDNNDDDNNDDDDDDDNNNNNNNHSKINNGFVNRSTRWLFPVKVHQLQLKRNQIRLFKNYAIYIIKSRSRINRIDITVKLINHSVLCYMKNSLKVLKRFCNLYSFYM